MSGRPPLDVSRTIIPAGTQLNSVYEIDAPIATGGMGEVYRGHSIQTGDPVAIKLIRSDLNEDGAAFALFRKEASALHNLHHEAIVRYYIFTIDPVLERPYLAMEFVDGQSLSAILRKSALSCEAVHRLMVRVASGLQAAHEQQIVHRDISPDNIIIPAGNMNKAKIIDFGIARSTRLDSGGTIIGSGFAGKYNYVSPEQLGLQGGEVTPKSDIYSLALVLAEALRQKPIDMGGNHVAVIEKRRKVPDLSDIDPRMRPLLERMLQPNPKDRPASMAEIAAWKLPAGRTKPPQPPQPPPEPFTLPISPTAIGAIVACIIVAGFGIYIFRPHDEVVEPPPKPDLTKFVTYYGTDKSCVLASPLKINNKEAYVDGYGVTTEPFYRLDGEFHDKAGFDATIGVHQVTPKQCAAVEFAQAQRNEQVPTPNLTLSTTVFRVGDDLTGTIDGTGGHQVDLLLVAEDGSVRRLASGLHPPANGNATFFSTKLGPDLADLANGKLQLVVAIASPQPLSAIATSLSAPASDIFPRLSAEARNAGFPLGVSLRSFRLDP